MSYNEEMNRIKKNKMLNIKCYTSLKDDETFDKLENMKTNLLILRHNHEEIIRKTWNEKDDLGSLFEIWLYVMADINEMIRRVTE